MSYVLPGGETTLCRLRLKAADFSPIPLYGKEPPNKDNNKYRALTGWPNLHKVKDERIGAWKNTWPDADNTGILTKFTPTFDGDILDAKAAAAVEKLVRKQVGKRGKFLKRIGLPPKFAIPFRTDAPFKKISIKLIPPGVADDDPELEKKLEGPEFLCDGQQVVAFGIHPDTRKPYRWNGVGEPGRVKRSALPNIDEKEARQLIDDAAELLIKQHGYRRSSGKKQNKTGPVNDDADEFHLLNQQAIENYAAWVPQIFKDAADCRNTHGWKIKRPGGGSQKRKGGPPPERRDNSA